MGMNTKITLLIFLCLLSISQCFSHSLNQFSYVFDQDEEGSILTIHCTPKGITDLIISLKPELEEESIIDLKAYYNEFTSYFNSNIAISINGNPINLDFKTADVLHHDATFTYQLTQELNEGVLEIEVTSFIGIYKKVHNYVTFITPFGKERCFLSEKETRCSLELQNVSSSPTTVNKLLIRMCIGLVILIAIVLKVLSFRKMRVYPG